MPRKNVIDCAGLLARRKLTIAFAESATAGRLCADFAATPPSGDVLKGGIVCYDACVKEDILKVPHKLINRYTPESAEVTEELAIRLRKLIEADIHVAVTGLPSPGGSETADKPVGTMFVHVLMKNDSRGFRKRFSGTPNQVISKTVSFVAGAIMRMVKN